MSYKYNYIDVVAVDSKVNIDDILKHSWEEGEEIFEKINEGIEPLFDDSKKKEIYIMLSVFDEAMRAIWLARDTHEDQLLKEGKADDAIAVDMRFILKLEIVDKEKPMRLSLIYRDENEDKRIATAYIAPYSIKEDNQDAKGEN